MPGLFSGMTPFGRGLISAGSAAGTAYRGWQDMQHRQLDDQIARQNMQLNQQRYELEKKREGLQEDEFGLKMWEQQQQLVQDALQRNALAKLLSALSQIPGTDPAKALNYKAGAEALNNGADWEKVSAAMGLDAKNMLAAARAFSLTMGGKEKGTKSAEEAATTKLITDAASDTDGGDGSAAPAAAAPSKPAAAAPPATRKTKAVATPFGDTEVLNELKGQPAGDYYDAGTDMTYHWSGTGITGRSKGKAAGGTP